MILYIIANSLLHHKSNRNLRDCYLILRQIADHFSENWDSPTSSQSPSSQHPSTCGSITSSARTSNPQATLPAAARPPGRLTDHSPTAMPSVSSHRRAYDSAESHGQLLLIVLLACSAGVNHFLLPAGSSHSNKRLPPSCSWASPRFMSKRMI